MQAGSRRRARLRGLSGIGGIRASAREVAGGVLGPSKCGRVLVSFLSSDETQRGREREEAVSVPDDSVFSCFVFCIVACDRKQTKKLQPKKKRTNTIYCVEAWRHQRDAQRPFASLRKAEDCCG